MTVISQWKTASLQLLLDGWLFCFTISLYGSVSDLFQISGVFIKVTLNLDIFLFVFSATYPNTAYCILHRKARKYYCNGRKKKGKYGPVVLITVESQRLDKAQPSPRSFTMELE